jgi:hypothetical protein
MDKISHPLAYSVTFMILCMFQFHLLPLDSSIYSVDAPTSSGMGYNHKAKRKEVLYLSFLCIFCHIILYIYKSFLGSTEPL